MEQDAKIEWVDAAAVRIRTGRLRTDLGDIEELAASIKESGLLHALTVDEDLFIIAGFRRYLALRLLQWPKLPIIRRSKLDEFEKLKLEIEENTKRKQFDWKEEAEGKAKLHETMIRLRGAPVVGSNSSTGWTIGDTATLLGESKGKVSEDLRLAKFTTHAVVGQRTSRIEALRAMKRTEEVEKLAAIAIALQSPGVASGITPGVFSLGRIINEDCRGVITRELQKESIDAIITDPPYGISIDRARWESVSTHQLYQDPSQQEVRDILNLVLRECCWALKPGRYMFMFCPAEFTGEWRQLMIDAGFNVMPRPLIWYKQRGSLTDFFTQFAPAYETFLCGWKGETRRPFTKPLADVFNYPRPLERWHKLERAPGVLNDIIETATSPNETILDPFCGGGSTLAAAARGLRRFLGIEKDSLAWARACQRLQLIEEGQDDLTDSSDSTEPAETGTSPSPVSTSNVVRVDELASRLSTRLGNDAG